MLRKYWVALLLFATVCGCSTEAERLPAIVAASPAPAASSPSAGTSAGSSTLAANGCTVDLMQVCQGYIDQPNLMFGGAQYTWARYTQLAHPHDDLLLNSGSLDPAFPGGVMCHVTVQSRKVTGAEPETGPPVAQTVAYFQGKQLCREQNPDYDKAVGAIVEKQAVR